MAGQINAPGHSLFLQLFKLQYKLLLHTEVLLQGLLPSSQVKWFLMGEGEGAENTP